MSASVIFFTHFALVVDAFACRFGPAGSAFTSDQLLDAVEVVVPYYA